MTSFGDYRWSWWPMDRLIAPSSWCLMGGENSENQQTVEQMSLVPTGAHLKSTVGQMTSSVPTGATFVSTNHVFSYIDMLADIDPQRDNGVQKRQLKSQVHCQNFMNRRAPSHRENGQSQTPSAGMGHLTLHYLSSAPSHRICLPPDLPVFVVRPPRSTLLEENRCSLVRFTIHGGTFNISGSQPLDPPSLPNRLSRYVEHLEARLAELEDLINLSMENNPNSQLGHGDETGVPELVCEGPKDGMDYSGSMATIPSQGPSNSHGSCIAECQGGFHSRIPALSMSTIPDSAGELPHSPRRTLAEDLRSRDSGSGRLPHLPFHRQLWRETSGRRHRVFVRAAAKNVFTPSYLSMPILSST
ncbi:hypothetical protein DFH09DRAFT_1109459 [Mycena vulgaris]|nr:hypothetical protein DFH09DRAFT_1109459 [Mycena vulgaris]